LHIKGPSSLVFPKITFRASPHASYSTTFFRGKYGLGSITNSRNPYSCPKLWIIWLYAINRFKHRNCKGRPFINSCKWFLYIKGPSSLIFPGLISRGSLNASCSKFFSVEIWIGKITNLTYPHSWPKHWIMWLSFINVLIHRNCKAWPYCKLLQLFLYLKGPSTLVFPRIISKANQDDFCLVAFVLGKCGLRSVTNFGHPHSWPKLWITWLSLINRLIHRNRKV